MKNYPNQASSFERIRDTLAVIKDLNVAGKDASSSEVLGYECARRGVYTFRNLGAATPQQLADRIAAERRKPVPNQGVLTYARELRRTLRDMGWIDANAYVTADGQAVLNSQPGSVEEQALLVEGLLTIETTNKDGSEPHHPIPVLLKLLARHPSYRREGLELALEPRNDSDAEFRRVARLYELSRSDRAKALGISGYQRDNAVKIFPTLAVAAGLVVEDSSGYYSLSQDGWRVIGQAPKRAQRAIAKRRGRRTTVGKLVTPSTVATRRQSSPPKTLTPEEQRRAAERLRERTASHQALVKRTAQLVDGVDFQLFEDEFSYDLLAVDRVSANPLYLFEMKSITDEVDAYARVRHAVGQLSYYEFFYVSPTWPDRKVVPVAVFDAEIPEALADYLQHEGIAAILVPAQGDQRALNRLGVDVLATFRQ